MQKKRILILVLSVIALLSVACSGTNAASVPTAAPAKQAATLPTTAARTVATVAPVSDVGAQSSQESTDYESQTVAGNSVTVVVKPVDLKAGVPSKFEIAMDTHSVNLSDDMVKVVVLRDDTGKEYTPVKWDGPDGGGHHRSGTIEFPALSSGVKSVTLVVKGIAKVPERTYKWDLRS